MTTKAKYDKLLSLAAILLVAGCAQVPPSNITRDRFEYGETLAESAKRQTLINIVRLRYADTTLFMDVTSVINSYSMAGKLSGGVVFRPSNPEGKDILLGGEGAWSNTPTVTYAPLGGDKYTRSLLRPVAPVSIFQMLQAGWPADLLFRTSVRSVNNISNRRLGGSDADPRFDEMLKALDRVMQSQAVGIRVEESKGGDGSVMVIRSGDTREVERDLTWLRDLWQIDPGTTEINVSYGGVQRNGKEIAVLTRSMLEIMLAIALDIDVPAAHIEQKRVLRGAQGDDTPRLVRIRSGPVAPADAFAAVPFKDQWFWIDDTDVISKMRFSFLMILFSLAEAGTSITAPVVTVPSR
ncbi:MAG: hypothetical protein KBA96_04035 [Rhodocyclaceae bacterium]|nr:hypothetical protein [Rhodocyclaceae bacterium]MBP7080258.1 hypothetical protein [Rhodocyclaceae bacterium]